MGWLSTVFNSSQLYAASDHASTRKHFIARHSGALDNMYQWRCMLSVFIYSSATVFVIVGGQPTIDDDDNELLRAELAKLVARNDILEQKVAKLEADQLAANLDTCTSIVFHYIRVLKTIGERRKWVGAESFGGPNGVGMVRGVPSPAD